MKLTDLDPRWLGAGGEGVTRDGQPVPERRGVAISFRCPCSGGSHEDWDRVVIEFNNPLDGGPPHDPSRTLWILTEWLVSQSSPRFPAEQWIDTQDLLGDWGGFNVLLARPRIAA